MVSLAVIKHDAQLRLSRIRTLVELDALWRDYFGSRGSITELLKGIKKLSAKERPAQGKAIHELRGELETLFARARARMKAKEQEERFAQEQLDVTIPAGKVLRGKLHPLTVLGKKVEEVFLGLGFSVVEGQEVETEHYNFDALNIPADHPARDMWDTLWLRSSQSAQSARQKRGSPEAAKRKAQSANDKPYAISDKLLLRTHTSPVQVRYMEQHEPPFRIIVPGRVYRYEATDASHDIQFTQVEGLMVGGRGEVTAAHFKAIIDTFMKALFGTAAKTRLRPSYFPFVEPGFEVDVSCTVCGAKGCSVCKQGGWLEVMGAGMVHPAVFEAVNYNPRLVQGFAFGMGLERLAMLKWRIPDIRFFRSGDMRFLRQF